MLIGSLIFHSLAVLSLDWNRSDAASLPKNNLGRENYYNFFQKTKNVFFSWRTNAESNCCERFHEKSC